MEKKYYEIKKKYLAFALSYLGFRYYKFGTDEDTLYSFENTDEFRQALTGLTNLKNKINK